MKKFLVGLFLALAIFTAQPAQASISNQTNKVFGSGNGVTTEYTFPFKIFNASELQVYLIDTLGVAHLKTLTSDYSVTISTTTEGGHIDFVVAPNSGWQTFIKRVEPLTQSLVLASEGALPAKQIENQLDRAMMVNIQNAEAIARAIKFPATSQLTNYDFPNPVANLAVGWDVTGTYLTNVFISGPQGPAGATGATGPQGSAASITVGTVGTGSPLAITNSGTTTAAVLNFTIPAGATGAQGPAGPTGTGTGDVLGPATNTNLYIPQWNGADSKVLKNGLPVGETGNSTVVKTSSGGKIDASIVPTLNQATTGNADTATTAGACTGNSATVTGFSLTSGKTLSVVKTMSFTAADDTGVYTMPTGTKTIMSTVDTAADSSKLQGYTIGTGGNQVVKLDAYAKLPAVDGSQLTGLPSSGITEDTQVADGVVYTHDGTWATLVTKYFYKKSTDTYLHMAYDDMGTNLGSGYYPITTRVQLDGSTFMGEFTAVQDNWTTRDSSTLSLSAVTTGVHALTFQTNSVEDRGSIRNIYVATK